jgi:hypothetical protein
VKIEKDMDGLKDEAVTRQGSVKPQIDANVDVFGGTPNTAVGPSLLRSDATRTNALPKDRISEHSRLFVSIRGLMISGSFRIGLCKSLIFKLQLRKSLISKPGLTQVVDFHVIFRYFQLVLMLFCECEKYAWRGSWPELVQKTIQTFLFLLLSAES